MATDRTLHEAIDHVLDGRRQAMSTRDLADEINAAGLYVRADGEPIEAKQVAARVRRVEYRDRYSIHADGRVSLARD